MKTTNNKRNFSFTMFLFEAINTIKKNFQKQRRNQINLNRSKQMNFLKWAQFQFSTGLKTEIQMVLYTIIEK